MPLDAKLKSDMNGNSESTQEMSEETKPAEAIPEETKPEEAAPAETMPAETDPADAKTAETKPAEATPAETKPADAKPAETNPEETSSAENTESPVSGAETPPEPGPDVQPGQPAGPDPETAVLLKVIGGQLETLSKSVMDLGQEIAAVAQKQDRNDRQLVKALKDNANFQIQVRQGMQHDIDDLKKQQSGEQFTPILRAIATIYVEYQGLMEDEGMSDLTRKNMKVLFEELEDILTDNGAEIVRSEVGETRQTRRTKIIEKIRTGDETKHNTIAVSRKPGVIRGNMILYPEYVDVFVYDKALAEEKAVNAG